VAAIAAAAAGALGPACVDSRSAMSPAGPAARTLADLGWPLLVGFTVVSAIMWGLIVWVVVRRTGSFASHDPVAARGGMAWVIVGGFVIPGVAFTASFVATLGSLSSFPMAHDPSAPPDIRVIGHQWWWEVEYLFKDPTLQFSTANEIHIPVGRSIEIELRSADVIHSFWAPRLHGKVDLIPGRVNHIRVQASFPGTYPGSCAEFCGLQHALMRFQVIAESPPEFQRWLERQREPAAPLAVDDPAARRGQAVFMGAACPVCHAIAGTRALATAGPDLTHIGSRSTIAAGWLPKDLATLHAWIVNAPSLKPGARMPTLTQLTGQELHDLVAYLEALR
jgi:cytochrome c oxidase subunit 2